MALAPRDVEPCGPAALSDGGAMVQCGLCPAMFYRQDDLDVHMNMHRRIDGLLPSHHQPGYTRPRDDLSVTWKSEMMYGSSASSAVGAAGMPSSAGRSTSPSCFSAGLFSLAPAPPAAAPAPVSASLRLPSPASSPLTALNLSSSAVWHQLQLPQVSPVSAPCSMPAASASSPHLYHHLSDMGWSYDGGRSSTSALPGSASSGSSLVLLEPPSELLCTDESLQSSCASPPVPLQPSHSAAPAAFSALASGPAAFSVPASSPAAFSVPDTCSAAFSVPATGPATFSIPATGPAAFAVPASSPADFSVPASSPAAFSVPASGPASFSVPASSPATFSVPAAAPLYHHHHQMQSALVTTPTAVPSSHGHLYPSLPYPLGSIPHGLLSFGPVTEPPHHHQYHHHHHQPHQQLHPAELNPSDRLVYKCIYCCREFDSAGEMQAHVRAVAESPHVCPMCHELCQSSWQLAEHTASAHCGPAGYTCGVCRQQFRFSHEHSRHIAQHIPPGAVAVSSSPSCAAAVEPVAVHSGTAAAGSAPGEMLELAAVSTTSFLKPASPCLPTEQLPPAVAPTDEQKKPFVCQQCGCRFVRRASLTRHRRQLHGAPDAVVATDRRKPNVKRICSCDKCGRIFFSQRRLKWHAEIHSRRPHTCSTCGLRFVHQSYLTRHVRQQHNGGYVARQTGVSVACPVCGKMYMRSSLNRHIKMVHERAKPFQCSRCGRSFAARCNLRTHELSHLSHRERPFRCKQCRKGFTTQRDLDDHLNTHLPRKLICRVCGREFGQRKALNLHLRDHEGRKEHVCPLCGRQFARKPYLTAHLRVHTGERPHTCAVCERSFASRSNYNSHVRNHTRRATINAEV